MPEPAPILQIGGLSRHFGGVRVIDGLDATVCENEILGIIGPNGAGKTTLFNLIAGVLAPSGGAIRYDGRDITALAPWDRCRLGIGRTYQMPKPFLHMSVFENVLVAAVHGGRLGLRAARSRAMAVLELADFEPRHAEQANQLPLLDLKRLELCRALAVAPRLLLLDEIAAGLTDAECTALLDIIRRVHERGTAIVWIEHVLHALRNLCTRLAVLHGGRFLADGAPGQVLADARVKQVYLGV